MGRGAKTKGGKSTRYEEKGKIRGGEGAGEEKEG